MDVKLIAAKPISSLILEAEVYRCGPNSTIRGVLKVLIEQNIGAVVIVDPDDKPIGIFTERDYLKKLAFLEKSPLDDTIELHMTTNPRCLSATDEVIKAMTAMRAGRFRHIVIVDDSGKLAGIVSIKDVINFIVDQLTLP